VGKEGVWLVHGGVVALEAGCEALEGGLGKVVVWRGFCLGWLR
jgi:hypothetical protein